MPRISRDEAVARIERELGDAPCVICALLDGRAGPPLVLCEARHALALLPRYGLCAGHVIVGLRSHVTRLTDVADDAWREASMMALDVARAVEAVLTPMRCYVASLGTPRRDLPMTCPHLHIHVVPVMEEDARPSSVLTWEHGVDVLSDDEGVALRDRLAAQLSPRKLT